MEHQSAVTYGNRFANGYLERDWTGVGISPKFDFIIIHESGHEWFGNAVSAADVSDMWIHEGWTTYLESLYVEHAVRLRRRAEVHQRLQVEGQQPGADHHRSAASTGTPPQDMYFKGALFLNTLRSVVNDDARWWKLMRDFYQHFKYQNIMTEDVVPFFNAQLGQDLTPIFDQYLRRAALPTLELTFDEKTGTGGVSLEGRRARVRDAGPRRHDAATWQIISRRPSGRRCRPRWRRTRSRSRPTSTTSTSSVLGRRRKAVEAGL